MSTVILIGGEGGSGKSLQSSQFPEQIAYCDFEYPKATKIISTERLITIFPCREFYGYHLVNKNSKVTFEKCDVPASFKKGQVNVPATYKLIKKTINTVLDSSSEYETIVLDSITDIREIVADTWLLEYRARDVKNRNRKVVGKDPSAWAQINKIVCNDILFPIINIGRIENKNVVFTAQMEDEWKTITLESGKEDTAKSGKRVIDAQNWVMFEIDVIAQLEATEKGRYFLTCKKTPKGVVPRMDITDKSVYEMLSERGVI